MSNSNPEDPDHGSVTVGQAGDEVETLRQKLTLLQQIETLQVRLNNPSGTKPAMYVKVPEGRYNMSPTEYRTYVNDCLSYHELTRMTDHEIVLQLRLNMDGGFKESYRH